MRWFIRRQVEPGLYFVCFGPNGCDPQKVWEMFKDDLEKPTLWPRWDAKPRLTNQEPRKVGWRRARSQHVGGGFRWYVEFARGVRTKQDKSL